MVGSGLGALQIGESLVRKALDTFECLRHVMRLILSV